MSRPFDYTTPIPPIMGEVDKLQARNALTGQRQQQQMNALAIRQQEGTLDREAGVRNAFSANAGNPGATYDALLQADPGVALEYQAQEDARALQNLEAHKSAALRAAQALRELPEDEREAAIPRIRSLVNGLGVDLSGFPGPQNMTDTGLDSYIVGLGGTAAGGPGLMSVPLTSRVVREDTGEVIVPAEQSSDSVPASIQEYREWADQQPEGGPRNIEDFWRAKTDANTAQSQARDQYTLSDIRNLNNDWQEAAAPVRDLEEQVLRMEVGMQQARTGNMVAGSQAVLVTFQKILDPTSVVRESEYARSAQGLSLFDQAAGAFQRLQQGGAGVPVEELEKFYTLAKEITGKLNTGYLENERERLQGLADFYHIPRHLVFEGGAAPSPGSVGPDVGFIPD